MVIVQGLKNATQVRRLEIYLIHLKLSTIFVYLLYCNQYNF